MMKKILTLLFHATATCTLAQGPNDSGTYYKYADVTSLVNTILGKN